MMHIYIYSMFHVFGVEIEWSWGLGGFSVHKQWTYLKQLNLYHFVTFFFLAGGVFKYSH